MSGLAAVFAAAALAQAQPAPVEVTTGVYVNQVREMSIRDHRFVVDFWVWFRWKKGGAVDPLGTFEIIGGTIESKANEVREELAGEWSYAAARVVAVIVQDFDLAEFPRDAQRLRLSIEDGEHEDHESVFIADPANSRLDPTVIVPGYKIRGSSAQVVQHSYHTNYGDITLPKNNESSYSRFEFAIDIERPGFGYTLKLVWGLWLSGLIALLALFIKPTNVDPRFGLGVGATFAAMANQFILSAALPEASVVTAADIVGMTTIVVILLTVAESVLSLWMYENDRIPLSKRLDRMTTYVVLTLYIATNAWALLF